MKILPSKCLLKALLPNAQGRMQDFVMGFPSVKKLAADNIKYTTSPGASEAVHDWSGQN